MLSAREVRGAICLVALATTSVTVACGSTVPASRFASSSENTPQAQGAPGGHGLSAPESPAASGASSAPGQSPPAAVGAGSGASRTATPSAGAQGPAGAAQDAVGGSHAPIQLGLLYAVNDGAQSAGINNGNGFSLKDVVQAFVQSYNASGGVGGRRIEPVYAEMHSASNDYESQTQAACAAFTQDHHVAAVLSNVGYYSENLLTCLSKADVPVVSGGWEAPDREDAGRFPLLITPVTLLGEARLAAVVDHLAAAGFLLARNRIGVVIEDCPVDQRVYRNGLAPAVQRAGLTVASTYQVRCFQSLQDVGNEASGLQDAVLQFRQSLVDRVMVVSQAAEANLVYLFSEGADGQRYFPGYALSSVTAPTVLALNAPADQLANMQGVGWLPDVDTADPAQAPPTTTGKQCLDRMRAAGIHPVTNADYTYVYGPCDTFTLYDSLLRATAGDATAASIMRALGNVGPRYVSASTVDGRTRISEGRVGAGAGRLFAFVRGRFEYTSAAFSL